MSRAEKFIIIVSMLVIILAYLTLLGPEISSPMRRAESAKELQQTLDELPEAENRWNAQPYSDYDATITMPCNPGSIASRVQIHVRNSLIQSLDEPTGAFPPTKGCEFGKWLPGSSFDTLRQALRKYDTQLLSLNVEFNPEYGFVSLYTSHPINGGMGTYIAVDDFQPVEPQSELSGQHAP